MCVTVYRHVIWLAMFHVHLLITIATAADAPAITTTVTDVTTVIRTVPQVTTVTVSHCPELKFPTGPMSAGQFGCEPCNAAGTYVCTLHVSVCLCS